MKTTGAERKRAFDQRQRDAGLVSVTVWIKPERRDDLKEYAKKLQA